MAEFFMEILSEEIPAKMQNLARPIWEILMISRLAKEQIPYDFDSMKFFSTPRRLIVFINDMADFSPNYIEERKGPSVDAPQQAIGGFLRFCQLEIDDLLIKEDKKGKYYVAEIKHDGRATLDVLADILPKEIANFTWEKSMRWGEGGLRWARPVHSITATLGGKTIVFEVGGIKSDNHSVKNFADYCTKLEKAGIIFDQDVRKEKILNDARNLCKKEGLHLIEDDALIDEITGLVESPFCIMGYVGREFLDLPSEVLQVSMKTHQKFLSVANAEGEISYFITVANKHNPSKLTQRTILEGNQRVLYARLLDAVFFWSNDYHQATKKEMKDWQADLQKITFHNKLGTQGDRVKRIAIFAKTHADLFKVDANKAETTANIMKLDLCSDMVKEFPELQGIMGGYYAKHAEHELDIVGACKEHYSPLGLKDTTPTAPLSILMALADKLDTLAGFWAVELTPTSSKDPFALRRAALGVIRLILDNNLRLSLTDLLDSAFKPFPKKDEQAQTKLMDFFHERLKIYLRDKHDIPADTIDACRFGQGETDFALLTNRAKALHAFRPDAEFQNLLQGFKRAHNILHAEQKKDGVFYEMPPEPQYFQDPTETELHEALNAAETALPPLMQKEQFAQMLQTLANLRAPIDAFFTQVQVNSDQSAVRRNRLCLLHKLCSVMKTFADFSRLNG